MHPDLLVLQQAAEGLLYMSESDYPFEVVDMGTVTGTMEDRLKVSAGKEKNALVEKVSLLYLLRHSTAIPAEATAEQKQKAERFLQLQNTLQQKLNNVEVYRIGTTQIAIFIVGKLSDGTFGGLRTTAIET